MFVSPYHGNLIPTLTGSDFTWNKFCSLQLRRVVFPVCVNGSDSVCVSCVQVLHQIDSCEEITKDKMPIII